MEKKIVYVITNPELGWNCVLGTYSSLKSAVESMDMEYIEGKHYYSYNTRDDRAIFEQELKD